MINHPLTLALALTLAAVTTAHAQPVRLELRIVPQSGAIPGTISDLAQHQICCSAPLIFRFEVQYRIVDLDPNDSIVPAGLSTARLNITVDGADPAALAAAPLSRFEAQLAGATPPPSPDSSGAPTGTMAGAAGLHRPFRQGIPLPSPNNAHPANGVLTSAGLSQISPLSTVQSDQGLADPNAFYGLYTFDWTYQGGAGITVTFAAEALADPMTGNRFTYFSDGNPTALAGAIATIGSTVANGPLGPAGACCGSSGNCFIENPSGCEFRGGAWKGPGLPCEPTTCPLTVGACCQGSNCTTLEPAACIGPNTLFAGANTSCVVNVAAHCCRADFNHNGDISVQDLFSYLAAYFASDPTANYNAANLTVQDLFDFLTGYFSGCD